MPGGCALAAGSHSTRDLRTGGRAAPERSPNCPWRCRRVPRPAWRTARPRSPGGWPAGTRTVPCCCLAGTSAPCRGPRRARTDPARRLHPARRPRRWRRTLLTHPPGGRRFHPAGGRSWRSSQILWRLHLAAQYLAGGALRQARHQPDKPRVLVRRHLLPGECAQFRGRGDCAPLERHGGTDLLAEFVMQDPDHGNLGDRRVLIQDLLDLARIDIEPAADDHVLLPVDNVEVAILVDSAEVTGAEPAAGNRRGRRLRLTPVPLHDEIGRASCR